MLHWGLQLSCKVQSSVMVRGNSEKRDWGILNFAFVPLAHSPTGAAAWGLREGHPQMLTISKCSIQVIAGPVVCVKGVAGAAAVREESADGAVWGGRWCNFGLAKPLSFGLGIDLQYHTNWEPGSLSLSNEVSVPVFITSITSIMAVLEGHV